MNQDLFQGFCLQLSGRFKEQFGRLAGDPGTMAAGRRERFAGRVLKQRGISRQEADRQLADFMRRNRNYRDLSGH